MFDNLYPDPKNALLLDRLSRLAGDIRALELSTREEYQAAVYSRMNAILSLGSSMTPLQRVTAEAPALVGDLTINLARLNRDAADIANQTLRVEDIAAQLYNLSATTQNSLRQQVREQAFGSNARQWIEAFLHGRQIESQSGALDYAAGVFSLPLLGEKEIIPTIAVGSGSIGEAEVGPGALTDGLIETSMVWNGTQLELILSLDRVQIINRLSVELDDYQGLELVACSTSPDGTIFEDVLGDLNLESVVLNGATAKFSGQLLLDFPARHMQRMRLVIEDRAGEARIALRGLHLYQRRYGDSAVLQSMPIFSPSGRVRFTSQQQADGLLVSITHQISYNGVHFTAIDPDSTFTLTSSPFWYKATLERASQRFDINSAAVIALGSDPLQHPDYTLRSSQARQLGNGLLERTLEFSAVTGPVKLREVPLPGSLVVEAGNVQLGNDEYSYAQGILSLSQERGSVSVTYQTSALGVAALAQRRDYYSPYLYEIRFERT